MIRRRIFIGTLLVLGFIGTSLGVVYWRFTNLPHPNESSHNQLMYWVVLKDLSQYDHDTQLALVNRFAGEANEIFKNNNAAKAQLSDAQSQRLLNNIELLKQVWFEDRIAQYCEIGNIENCEVYLAKQITLLDDFGNIAFENAKVLYPDKDAENLTTISDELLADIDKWLTETPPEKKDQTLQAVREATVFWLATQDLAVQLMDARKELAVRVIAELENGMNLKSTTSIVSKDRAKRLHENALLLMEAWVHLLASEYAELPKEKRADFVDQKIAAVQQWKLLEFLATDSAAPASPLAGINQFNQIVTEWTERADDLMRPKLKKLHSAFQRRIFMSLFKSPE